MVRSGFETKTNVYNCPDEVLSTELVLCLVCWYAYVYDKTQLFPFFFFFFCITKK